MVNKICPFCKKNVDVNNAICSHCERVLIETFSTRSPKDDNYRTSQQSESPPNTKEKKKRFMQVLSRFMFWKSSTKYRKDGNVYSAYQDKADSYKKIIVTALVIIFIFGLYSRNPNKTSSISIENRSNQGNITESRKSPEEIVEFSSSKKASEYSYLSNGMIIDSISHYFNGAGKLKIKNGTNSDAVVKLVKDSIDESIHTVYIRAKSSHAIIGISPGIYRVLFAHGKDWDDNEQTFLIDRSYSKFKDIFDYTIYGGYEITLHPVLGGTAETPNILSGEFDKY